jgi:hypothetical protein
MYMLKHLVEVRPRLDRGKSPRREELPRTTKGRVAMTMIPRPRLMVMARMSETEIPAVGMAVMVILARAMAAAVTAEMGITYHP